MSTARLILLDAENVGAAAALRAEQLTPHLPGGLAPLPPLRLSAFDAPPVVRRGPHARPVDWPGLGAAVVRLVDAARVQGHDAEPPVHTLVTGHAPLPVFVRAGYELSAWAGAVTFAHRRDNGTWDILRPESPAPRARRPPFDAVTGLPKKPAPDTGTVAVFVSTRGTPAQHTERAAFGRLLGTPLARRVEICSHEPLTLGAGNVRAVAEHLRCLLARVHDLFPRRQELALCVAGPAPLAFLVGRALEPHHGPVHISNYASTQGGYERAFTLP